MDLRTRVASLQAKHKDLIKRLTQCGNDPELKQTPREWAAGWSEQLELARERVFAPLTVAFVAQVGRGKSSLIASATGLRLDVPGSPKQWSVLPVGDGRTTLGETHVVFEDRTDIELSVVPVPQKVLAVEIRIFAEDLFASVGKSRSAKRDNQPGEELYNLLRAWFVPAAEDRRAALTALAKSVHSPEELEALLLSRVDLERRSRPYLQTIPSGTEALAGLRQTLRDLMEGELDDAPVPERVVLRVPRALKHLHAVIDTRGIDADASRSMLEMRPDLNRLIQDPNTLLVVCSDFESAPDSLCRNLLEVLKERVGVRFEVRSLRVLIVDKREDEEDKKDQKRQAREGAERVATCVDILRRQGLDELVQPDSVVAIDVRRDPNVLREMLEGMAVEARLARVEDWAIAVTHAEGLLDGALADVEFAAKSKKLDLELWWAWDAALARGAGPFPSDGLEGVAWRVRRSHGESDHHWSHVHAAVRRRGRYTRLDLSQAGGAVAALGSALSSMSASVAVTLLRERVTADDPRLQAHFELRDDQFLVAVMGHMEKLQSGWSSVLSDYFDSSASDELWDWCKARWGQGPGYLQAIAERFEQESERAQLRLPAELQPALPQASLPPRPALFSLSSVTLQNFRGIAQQTIPLSNTVVLVGENGTGKTCWLEAIVASIGALLPEMGAGPAPELGKRDVRQVSAEMGSSSDLQYQLPMSIEVDATVEGRTQSWRRAVTAPDFNVLTEAEGLESISRQIGVELRMHSQRQLPVLAYYGTQRLWPADLTLPPIPDVGDVGTRLTGYENCLHGASTQKQMMHWMRKYTFVALQESKMFPQLQAIERAVVACVEDAVAFAYNIKFGELQLTLEDGTVKPFRLLSDGYRNVVAMVADIAWRASVLNPQLRALAPELAEGVVLIDEIDLHLHPKWQRRVLGDLRRAFPKLQFITTTHSPFIIQSLRPGQLINLDPNARDVPYADQSPEDIAEHIMGVNLPQRSRRRQEEARVAARYYDLLAEVPSADPMELSRLKGQLDDLLAPYSENQAFVVFLQRKRALAESRRT